MKTAISLPDPVFMAAEKLSRRKKVSRSELYATAIRWYIDKESNSGITEQLNKVYDGSIVVDEAVEMAAIADLPKDDWS